MALLTGMTEDGREVPVQVDGNGRLIAEGLQGQKGDKGDDANSYWNRTGTELSPTTASDSVFTQGPISVGGTPAAPKIALTAQGEASFAGSISIGGNLPASPNIALSAGGVGYFAGSVGIGRPASQGVELEVAGSIRSWSEFPKLYLYNGTSQLSLQNNTANFDFYRDTFLAARITLEGHLLLGGTLPEAPNIKLSANGNINAKSAVALVYADNAAAKAAGMVPGDFYRKADGTLMIAY